jgi:hypothetical protein
MTRAERAEPHGKLVIAQARARQPDSVATAHRPGM